jgi:hypothetical protein
MPDPQPIETTYGGTRFRSRLEARWAVFFNELDIEWHFELEGFELPSGRYLPDFWLPGVKGRNGDGPVGIWFEVKRPGELDQDPRWTELAFQTGHPVYVAAGLPPRNEYAGYDEFNYVIEEHGESWDLDITFCDCHHGITMQYGPEGSYHRRGGHPRIAFALNAARSARFEFGHSGP